MVNKPNISNNPKLRPDEDYNYLRNAGRQYIEELGSAFWTDYNEHDPGITILEALCFAITELGYRTSLPIEDLLTQNDGTIPATQTFFTAKEILTQSALNINDYRKLLIDIDGVENAWLFAKSHYKNGNSITVAGEVPIFADHKNDALTFTPTIDPVYIKGLYKVILDLDDDPQLGDLNNGEIDVNVLTLTNSIVELDFIFPNWEQISDIRLFALDMLVPQVYETFDVSVDFSSGIFGVGISFALKDADGNIENYIISGSINIGLQPVEVAALDAAGIKSLLTDNNDILAQQVLKLYLLKIQKAKTIVQNTLRTLNCHRNLCEDFVTVSTVKNEEIAFCFDIDIIPSADMEEVEANVFFTIKEYLNPSVKFYLLKEMLQKINPATNTVYTVDEIFDGPKLTHGFVDTTELENTNLITEIYASEIISKIMNIQINNEKVILAVRNFRMTAYDDTGKSIPEQANQQWCIKVNEWLKPILSTDRSKIIIYKNQFPYLAQFKETNQTLQWLESIHAREKLNAASDDFPVPLGTYFPLETYTSIQQLFPPTYGIGNAALPSTATEERKAQARQLKAYLLFYDQLLGDFFMQLKNTTSLFSTADTIQTYYAQFIDGFNDYDAIYAKDGSNNYLFQKNVLEFNSAPASVKPGWETLYEQNETFIDRRNRFLDHLMARFGESFNEYVFMMYTLDSATQSETKIDPIDVIKNKMELLSDYPRISYNRVKSFNYCPQDAGFQLITTKLWNTDNVSGIEEKLCLLGGFGKPANGKSYYRRFLRCIGSGKISLTVNPIQVGLDIRYNFALSLAQADADLEITLTSINYTSLVLLNTDLILVINNINSNTAFAYTVEDAVPNFIINATITSGVQNIVVTSNLFTTQAFADDAIKGFIKEFGNSCDNEGLYLIEHTLLRPRNKNYVLAPVCLDDDCETCCEDDPYSFRMSIVMPYWVSHFNNMNFREYFEKLAREEAPAHCMVKVCWINQDAMLQFEICYHTWIQAMAAYYSNKSTINDTFLTDANNNLTTALFSLHSEYPVATLHDCEESKDTNPVMLGKTVLGTIK